MSLDEVRGEHECDLQYYSVIQTDLLINRLSHQELLEHQKLMNKESH